MEKQLWNVLKYIKMTKQLVRVQTRVMLEMLS